MSNAEILKAAAGADEHELARDEDFSKAFAPVVQLAEVETKTGEEDEDVIFKIRAKLFRFAKDSREWKERGTGDVRLLQHKTNKKIRLLMRREKTLKICLNQFVNAKVELKENVGSDRSWVWQGVDYADGERDDSLFAIRFRDSTNAGLFKTAYDDARKVMEDLSKPSAQEKTGETEEDKKENGANVEETKDEPKEETKEETNVVSNKVDDEEETKDTNADTENKTEK